MATLEGWCGRIGSASRGKGGESRIFPSIRGNPDFPQLTAHFKQLEVIICNHGISIINGKGAKLQFYTPPKRHFITLTDDKLGLKLIVGVAKLVAGTVL